MNQKYPYKFKCLECAQEKSMTLKKSEVKDFECEVCKGRSVHKKNWEKEILKLVKEDITKLLEYDEDLTLKNNRNNKIARSIFLKVNLIELSK